MKDSDIQNARRIVKLIRQLTAEHQSAVAIICDDPQGPPDCTITALRSTGPETFNGETILDCLLQAIAARGIVEEPDPIFHIADTTAHVVAGGGEFKPIVASGSWDCPINSAEQVKAAVERAKADVGLKYDPAPVTGAAVKALEMWARCKEASGGTFNGGATAGFNVAGVDFELTINPKRQGFAFVETADSIDDIP